MKECLETINGIISDYVYGKIDAGGLKRISEISRYVHYIVAINIVSIVTCIRI